MSNEQNWTPGTLTVARVIECIDALEGISDPAAYIAALRECVEALDEARSVVSGAQNEFGQHVAWTHAINSADTALANLREVTK